jgi:hypothetical protein
MIKVQPHCEYYLCNFPTGECQGMCQKAAEDDDDIQDYKKPWVGLTDEEVDLLEELYAPPVHPDFVNDADHCLELIRHVEAKLKEKNT